MLCCWHMLAELSLCCVLDVVCWPYRFWHLYDFVMSDGLSVGGPVYVVAL